MNPAVRLRELMKSAPHVPILLFLFTNRLRAHRYLFRVRATWYGENIESGADVIMMDLRWPWWPSGTYFANWNVGFNPKPNNITFYAGFVSTVPDGEGFLPNPDMKLQEAFRPGSVWTFWGSDAAGTPVRFTDVAPNLFIKNDYGGEGSSGTTGAEGWPFVKQQRWFTMLARVWKTDDAHAFVGRWIKDLTDGKWHLIGIARLPIPATSFAGNSGFIEPLSNEKAVRSLHRRLGYYRKDGAWSKADTISIDKTQYVVVNVLPEAAHEYAAIEYAQRPDLLPQRLTGTTLDGGKKHYFTTKQPALPALDKPSVINAKATRLGNQIAVHWEVPETSSPTFGYTLEIFDNAACQGNPILAKEERIPSVCDVIVSADTPQATVKLTVRDVFDQTATALILTPQSLSALQPAPMQTDAIPGLAYELRHQDQTRKVNYFYEPLQKPDETHRWLTLSELEQGKLVKQGIARGFDLSVREQRNEGYGLKFSGFLRVPTDGIYLLHAQIDGAYQIQLDGTDALTWDGQHGTTERSAARALARGDHAIVVTHVFDHLPARNFMIEWQGPGIARQQLPLNALFTTDAGKAPHPKVQATANGDGTGSVSVAVEPQGHTIKQTVLFLGALQLASSKGSTLEFSGPLPHGESKFWVRVLFDEQNTVDSEPVFLTVNGKAIEPPWTGRNVGDTKAAYGMWQTGSGAFQFFGNGMHIVTQKVQGDFTVTCRVTDYNGAKGEPVNAWAWVGLTAREHGEKRNWEWGRDFHLVQSARNGLRASADFTDFGAGRVTSYELPAKRPWLRIARQGNIWTAWSSEDGKSWELGAYQFKKTAPEMEVGLFISALPQDARAHYHAAVSDLAITPGLATDLHLPEPPVAAHTNGLRLTGVVMARSDAKIVVVRSPMGLWRSKDGGNTWDAANGNLTDADLPVRSVAIHPKQPEIMLRAGGNSLWRTTDGGAHWEKLALDANFDATGPSALCGEVVAFDVRNPDTIYVGSESKGCFKSMDQGLTWTSLGLVGERVTAITVWPWEKYYPAPAKGMSHLCVITCPDQWMKWLGRGEPQTSTKAASSRSYISPDNGKSLAVSDERSDTGFYNVVFDKALQSTNEMRYATTHGYQSQVFAGSHMALYPEAKHLEWLRPFTALSATAMGDQKFGRMITQALNPSTLGRVSRSERWGFEWHWLPSKGTVPQGGLIAVSGDESLGQHWWFVYTDGLYQSADGGTTFTKVLDELGRKSE